MWRGQKPLKLDKHRRTGHKTGNIYSIIHAGETFYRQSEMDEAYEQGHPDAY